ncbi:MAG: thiamine-phosphate kinase [Acidibacillus sp.]|uniref:Thiamine-monophosphate kinase n=1 Tax=Sulfoacidibacillus ferrooxidans TaxID=2005001 RepID=A0A9X1VAG1_9BACL|nr:thiamine-phosphate kinase [Sulfoacidibacillus ferrooxidans]MCI0183710.1 Thiamine-monophosphate kinase [Sulfoacidibacillus ferrooxidans]MCY0892250.1 thiamine-phosphate kinase [Acidibacillus sp.]
MGLFIRELGEFGLIERLSAIVARTDPRVLVNIGDDAAVVRYDRPVVMTTDALVDGVHFRDDLIDPTSVGYKSLVASLSDIAAMGGKPLHAMVALAVPFTEQVERIEAIYRGLDEACAEFGVTIVGGDVVSTSGPLVITVSVTGELVGERPLLRSGAQVGDVIFVTGDVGGSAAYLHSKNQSDGLHIGESDEWILQKRHQRPVPQLMAGHICAQNPGCTSANDVSDGLSSELHEIALASGVRMMIDADRIPTLPALRHYARVVSVDPLQFALYGGEDYQIVGTMNRVKAGSFLSLMQAHGIRISLIGQVKSGEPNVYLNTRSGIEEVPKKGYDHFPVGVEPV